MTWPTSALVSQPVEVWFGETPRSPLVTSPDPVERSTSNPTCHPRKIGAEGLARQRRVHAETATVRRVKGLAHQSSDGKRPCNVALLASWQGVH